MSEQVRMSENDARGRRRLTVVVVLSVLVGISLWLSQWGGITKSFEASAGEVVRLQNGLTATVPSGWSAEGSNYADIPAWMPIGSPNMRGSRAQIVVIEAPRSGEETPAQFALISVYRDDPALDRYRFVEDGGTDVAIYVSQSGRIAFAKTALPGSRIGYVVARTEGREPKATLAEAWSFLGIQGASLE